jgi:membrane-bound lytic murein transglycosylase B
LAVITPLVFAGAVGATPRPPAGAPPLRDAEVTPLAAVAPAPDRSSGPAVVAVARPPSSVRVAAATTSAPPPATLVYQPGGTLRIPAMALSAYRNAEQKMAAAEPDCGISWNLLAGIGRIESLHANGGATDARGTTVQPIYGPVLDGSLPGNEVIVQSSSPTRVVYARAMGPMQFLPGTWSRYAADGDGDGRADPQNLFDSTLAAARYLCSGGLNLRDQSHVLTAILRYNNSMPYARNVLGWAGAYTTGVVPVDLPPIIGPPPPLGDVHLENPAEGLGPDLPLNAHGLPSTDPLSRTPLIDLSQPVSGSQQPGGPWQQTGWPWQQAGWPNQETGWPWPLPNQPPRTPTPACSVICIEPQATPPAQGAPSAPMPPYAVPPSAPMPPYAVPPAAPMPPYAVPPAAPMPPPAVPPPPAPMPPYAVPPADPPPGNGPLLGPPG